MEHTDKEIVHRRYENGVPADNRPRATLYTILAGLFIFVGLLAAIVLAIKRCPYEAARETVEIFTSLANDLCSAA